MGIGSVGAAGSTGAAVAQIMIQSPPAGFEMQRDSGQLTMDPLPLILEIDTWASRQADLGIYKPFQYIGQSRARAESAVSEATLRIVDEGNQMSRIEEKNRPIPQIAGNRLAQNAVGDGQVDVKFMTPPSISWSGGGVSVDYLPAQLAIEFSPQRPLIDFVI